MANTSVFGIYANRAQVEKVVDRLRTEGFRSTDISILLPENIGNKDIGVEAASKAPEGATAGRASGAVVGGVLGWLAGISALAIPGIRPAVGRGPHRGRFGRSRRGRREAALSLGLSPVLASPNTKPSATKAASVPAASSSQSTPMTRIGKTRPSKF
ncbi:MAG: general stress protein [Bryobacterales bacterium]